MNENRDKPTSDSNHLPTGREIRLKLRIRIIETLSKSHSDWTMRDVAENMGVDYQTVLFWNRGVTQPKLSCLVKLAKILKCSLDELVCKLK